MIHGGGQTASNFLATPDGRRGWADDFVANGYAVYVVDQSGRGRSGFFGDSYGKTRKPSVENVEQRFTAPERKQLWPQASLHTQWPGTGDAGGCGVRRLLRQPGRDHRRRGADRADEPRSRRQAARPHRAGGAADAFAGRRDRLEHRRRAAAAGERHSGDRAQRAADPRDRRKGCAGLFRRRRGRASLGRHAREDHIRSAGADAGRPQARAAGASRTVPGSCVAFCRPSRRGRCRTCVGFPFSSW